MIVDSSLDCLHSYPTAIREVTILPGRNLIPDDVGRLLMQSYPFLEMVNAKATGYAGRLLVILPPAPEYAAPSESAQGKGVKGKGKGGKNELEQAPSIPAGRAPRESPTSNRALVDALSDIRECSIVETLQEILVNDPREEVQQAAEGRIRQIAEEAMNEKGDAGA